MLSYDIFSEHLPSDDYTAQDVFNFYKLFCDNFHVPSDQISLKSLSALCIYVNACMDATHSFSTEKEENTSVYFSFSNIRLCPTEVTEEHPITIQLYFEFQALRDNDVFLFTKAREIAQTLLQHPHVSNYYIFLTYTMIGGDFVCLQKQTRD